MTNPIDRGAAPVVHVKPAPGRAVRMPERLFALLPDDGMEVTRNAFWSRRISAGDVVVVTDEPSKPVKHRKEQLEK